MKYGETIFDILYLLFVITSGIILLIKSKKNRIVILMGLAALILGIGDSFHLIPRCLNYFIDYNFAPYLGIGKLVTSITMTIFYIVILFILKEVSHNSYKIESLVIYLLAVCRIILCSLPQNDWLSNNSPYIWDIMRNVPFALIGAIMIKLLFDNKDKHNFRFLWLYVLLSFAFYIIVVIGAPFVELLGIFMIPKTICYILMIVTFDMCFK